MAGTASQTVQVIMTAKDLMTKRLRKGETRLQMLSKVAGKVLPTAMIAGAAAMTAASRQAARFAREIEKSAAATGLGIEKYQAMADVFKTNGVSVGEFSSAMSKFNETLGDALLGEQSQGEYFNNLGVSIRNADGSARDAQEVFMDVVDALANTKDAAMAAVSGNQILGGSFDSLKHTISGGSGSLKSGMLEATTSGRVLSEALVRGGAEADREWNKLGNSLSTLTTQVSLKLVPAVGHFVKLLNHEISGSVMREIAAANKGGAEELVAEIRQSTDLVAAELSTAGFGTGALLTSDHAKKVNSEIVRLVKQAEEGKIDAVTAFNAINEAAVDLSTNTSKAWGRLTGAQKEALTDQLRFILGLKERLEPLRKAAVDDANTKEQERQNAITRTQLLERTANWEKYYSGLKSLHAGAAQDRRTQIEEETRARRAQLEIEINDLKNSFTDGDKDEMRKQGLAAIKDIERSQLAALNRQIREGELTHEKSIADLRATNAAQTHENSLRYLEGQKAEIDRQLEAEKEGTERYRLLLQERERVTEEHNRAVRENDRATTEARIGAARQMVGALGSLGGLMDSENKKQFEKQKRFNIAMATADTYLAALQVYRNPLLVDPVSKKAAMAATIIGGLATVAKIKKTKFGGGGADASVPGGGEAEDEVAGIQSQGTGGTGEPAQPVGSTTIYFSGRTADISQVRELVEAISDEAERGGNRLGKIRVVGGDA